MRDQPKIRCLVVDDEPLAVQLISDYILQEPSLVLVHATTSPLEALPRIYEGAVDVLFLDIQMPELSGMNLLKLIDGKCQTVLITAYQEYALEGYAYNVLDYLLKPVTHERFQRTVQKIHKLWGLTTVLPKVTNLPPPDYLFFRTEHKLQKVNFSDLLYLEGLRDYVALHTLQGKFLSLESMRGFEERLPTHLFIRIHKSYIVAIQHIQYIEKGRVVIGTQYLPVGDAYKEGLQRVVGLR